MASSQGIINTSLASNQLAVVTRGVIRGAELCRLWSRKRFTRWFGTMSHHSHCTRSGVEQVRNQFDEDQFKVFAEAFNKIIPFKQISDKEFFDGMSTIMIIIRIWVRNNSFESLCQILFLDLWRSVSWDFKFQTTQIYICLISMT